MKQTHKKSGPVVVICDYDGTPAKLVWGHEIYPHRPDLYGLSFWKCETCGAFTGCHKGSPDHKPLGRLANAEMRSWKIKAHAAFDPTWKSGKLTRRKAYLDLRDRLGMDRMPHMGFMDLATLKRVVELYGGSVPPAPPSPVPVSL